MKASRKKKRAVRPKGKRASPAATKNAKPLARAGAPDPLDEFILSAARNLNLKLEHGWLPAIRDNLKLTLMLGAQVGEFALPDDTEPAPVFGA